MSIRVLLQYVGTHSYWCFSPESCTRYMSVSIQQQRTDVRVHGESHLKETSKEQLIYCTIIGAKAPVTMCTHLLEQNPNAHISVTSSRKLNCEIALFCMLVSIQHSLPQKRWWLNRQRALIMRKVGSSIPCIIKPNLLSITYQLAWYSAFLGYGKDWFVQYQCTVTEWDIGSWYQQPDLLLRQHYKVTLSVQCDKLVPMLI